MNCKQCGADIVLVQHQPFTENALKLASANQIILIPIRKILDLPLQVCISCRPNWLLINKLGLEYADLQLKIEDTIRRFGDFEAASEILASRRRVEEAILELVYEEEKKDRSGRSI